MIGGVQRLVQIADEMNQEFQRQQPFRRRRAQTAELRAELFDLVHHAVLSGTLARDLIDRQHRKSIASALQLRMVDFDVDKVPGGGFAMPIAILVGPGCAAGKIRRRERVAIAREQRI